MLSLIHLKAYFNMLCRAGKEGAGGLAAVPQPGPGGCENCYNLILIPLLDWHRAGHTEGMKKSEGQMNINN